MKPIFNTHCFTCSTPVGTHYDYTSIYNVLCVDCAETNYGTLVTEGSQQWSLLHPTWDQACIDHISDNGPKPCWFMNKDSPLLKMLKAKGKDLFTPIELTDSEHASLSLISQGKAWKVEYSRLERLINYGYVNAMGSALTIEGKGKL
jgi:hypothetical protein